MKRTLALGLCWLAAYAAAQSTWAVTINVDKDARLCESSSEQNDNYGGDNELWAGWTGGTGGHVRDTSLLQFNLGSIPVHQTITSAKLKIYYVSAYSFQVNDTMTIRADRLNAGTSWYENTGAGGGLDGEGVNWLWRSQYYAVNQEWSGGTIEQKGGLSDCTDDGNPTVNVGPTAGYWLSIDVANSVRKWYWGTAENNGLLLQPTRFGQDSTMGIAKFSSSEGSYVPYLDLTYAQETVRWSKGAGSFNWDTSTPNWVYGDNVYTTYVNSPTPDKVLLDDTGGSGTCAISIGGTYSPASVEFANTTAKAYTIESGTITGPGAITKNGAGTVSFTTTSLSHTGGTQVNLGTLNYRPTVTVAIQSLNFGTAPIVLAGGKFGFNVDDQFSGSPAVTLTNNFTATASSTLDTTPYSNSPLVTLSGSFTLTSPLNINVGGSLTKITGQISGGSALTKTGAGTLVLTNTNNSYGDTIVSGGILRLGASNVLPNAYTVSVISSQLDFDGLSDTIGALQLTNASAVNIQQLTLGGNVSTSGGTGCSISGGTVVLTAPRTFTQGDGTLTVSSAISGNYTLTKAGGGTLMLANAGNSYGETVISGGRLSLAAAEVIPNNKVTISSATLDLNGKNETIGALEMTVGTVSGSGTLTVGGDVTSSGTSNLAGGTFAFNADRNVNTTDGTLTIGSAIAGGVKHLTKAGSGSLMLAGVNSYGNTYVVGGTLRLGKAGCLPDNLVSVSSATLDMNSQTEGIGSLALSSGSVTGAGQLTLGGNVTSSGSSLIDGPTVILNDARDFTVTGRLTVSTPLSGSGSLRKLGSGSLSLSAACTYPGVTEIIGGSLALGGGSINNSSGITIDGGTLTTTSTTPITVPISLVSGTIRGTGAIGVPVTVGAGGILSPGLSPGTQPYTAGLTWAGGGTLAWEVDLVDPTSVLQTVPKGKDPGCDWLNISGSLEIVATQGNAFIIDIWGLLHGMHGEGPVIAWDKTRNYTWTIATADAINGFDPLAFRLQSDHFMDFNPMALGSLFTIAQVGNEVRLNYVVPEPATLTMLVAAMVVVIGAWHRRNWRRRDH